MKVFTFCIFGGLDKYCLGLLNNIKIIIEKFPQFEIWIYLGSGVPQSYIDKYAAYPQVKLIPVDLGDCTLTVHRCFVFDDKNVEFMFSRDADSRITDRDEWLIRDFMASDKNFHIIRDHFWHKDLIQAGMWGARPNKFAFSMQAEYDKWIIKNTSLLGKYGIDQKFLTYIYTLIKHDLLVHTNIVAFRDEKIEAIPEWLDQDDFVGNVYLFDKNGQEYREFKYQDFDIAAHINWLDSQGRRDLIVKVLDDHDMSKYDYSLRSKMLTMYYVATFYTKDSATTQKALAKFETEFIDEFVIKNSNYLFGKMRAEGYKIVGTTDVNRRAGPQELVICYGNFLHDVDNLPHCNQIYRHAIYYNDVKHDVFEYHEAWDQIDQIYILNLVERRDRYMEMLVELCKMKAPLDRIFHYKAEKKTVTGVKQVDIYAGATKNHLDVVEHFIKNKFRYCVVFEDDFTFTGRIETHLTDLLEFMKRGYDFEVCLLSTSKCHDCKKYDDLLCLSHQVCTTTSGYMLKRETVMGVLECFRTGYDKIIETGNFHTYVCDRYWAKLQKNNKFFYFRRKMGYQRPNYSSITTQTDCHFD